RTHRAGCSANQPIGGRLMGRRIPRVRVEACLLGLLAMGAIFPASAIGQAPAYLYQWGSQGIGPGQFNLPSGIVVDGLAHVYVADFYGGLILKFTTSGSLVRQWAGSGSYGLAVDASGHLFATDWPTGSVSEFAGDGTFITRWGGNGGADGQLSSPTGITVSPL